MTYTRQLCCMRLDKLVRECAVGQAVLLCESAKNPGGLVLAEPQAEASLPAPFFTVADLSTEERHLVEAAYCGGAVSVLCCTSTMAVGVNLPARRVIFHRPYVGNFSNLLNVAT